VIYYYWVVNASVPDIQMWFTSICLDHRDSKSLIMCLCIPATNSITVRLNNVFMHSCNKFHYSETNTRYEVGYNVDGGCNNPKY